MKRLFLSADIEGTCGIAHWDETENGKIDYPLFAEQMTREVAAACEGILDADSSAQILIRDAHDSARNLRTAMLPQKENINIFRGWGCDPYSMMSGIDETFSGALFTGYHSACSWDGNPLSHTMNLENVTVRVNGEIMSELMMNSLTAAMFGVPVLMVSGDEMLCDWFLTKVPKAKAVPVSHGRGNGSISIMPQEACRRIRETAASIAAGQEMGKLFPMPDSFEVEVCYRRHFNARSASWYPGAEQISSNTTVFRSKDWMDVLKFFHFCL